MTSEQWKQIKNLFQKAIELPKSERQIFLEKQNAEKVVHDKVLEMLNTESDKDDILNTLNLEANMFSDLSEGSDQFIGKQVGLYKINKHIGEGGMGNVYHAERVDDFHKKVALKIIKRGMDTDALLNRFRRERQILANLVHPNIARLLDGGSTADGLPYLVMEHIEGLPITEYCDQHRLTISQRLKLFLNVCDAVSFAHQNLVIHRDIKPNNIIVNNEGVPKLLDFGIAKLLDPNEEELQELTVLGANILTPEFSSPEQIQGKQITTSSDVYSLGMLLYTLLTGQRPYHFDNRSPGAVEKVITTKIPTLPSSLINFNTTKDATEKLQSNNSIEEISNLRSVGKEKLRRILYGDLDIINLKALQKEPERRYTTVEQFSQDIKRHLKGLPVDARKDTVIYRAKKFIRRHRIGFAIASIMFLIINTAVFGIIWQGQIAKQEAAKAKQTLSFVKQMLAAANPLESGKELTVEQLLDEAGKRIPKELHEQPKVENEIRSILGEAYQSLGYYDKARIHFVENLSLLQKQYGNLHSLVANGTRELAVLEHYKGDYSRADSLYRRAIDLYRQIGETNSGDYAIALNDFGTINLDQAKYDSAIIVFEESFKIMRNVFGENHFQVGSVLNNLAFAFDDMGDYKMADSLYKQALRVFRHNYSEEHPEIANTLNNYAFVKLNIGDTLGSLNLHQQALDMWRNIVGNDHPDIGLTLHNIAAVTFYKKDYDNAETKMREVINIFSKNYEPDHPFLGSAYFMMGRILNAQKKYQEAEKFMKKSLEIREAKLETGHPQIGSVYYELGKNYFSNNQLQSAEKWLLKAHQLYINAGDQEKGVLHKTKLSLVKIYEKWGKPDLANKYRDR